MSDITETDLAAAWAPRATRAEPVCMCWIDFDGTYHQRASCERHAEPLHPKCERCGQELDVAGEGAAFDHDGRWIHPFGSECFALEFGDVEQ